MTCDQYTNIEVQIKYLINNVLNGTILIKSMVFSKSLDTVNKGS